MKMTIEGLRNLVEQIVAEAKKKKEKELDELVVKNDGHIQDHKLDFSAPLGAYNLYRNQGQVNWGPQTSSGPKIDDQLRGSQYSAVHESALRSYIRNIISESFRPDPSSAWAAMVPPVTQTIWESVMHWYDFERRGLGQVKEDADPSMDEKRIGFKKLKKSLAHEKGVKDAGALAASIGRKKYGSAGMAKKSAAGRK